MAQPADAAKTFGLLPDRGQIWLDFADIKHDYTQEFYQSYSSLSANVLGPVSLVVSAQLETTAWQHLRWPVAFFATNGKDFFLVLFYIQKEILKSGALSRNMSTTYVVWLHSARPWEII